MGLQDRVGAPIGVSQLRTQPISWNPRVFRVDSRIHQNPLWGIGSRRSAGRTGQGWDGTGALVESSISPASEPSL